MWLRRSRSRGSTSSIPSRSRCAISRSPRPSTRSRTSARSGAARRPRRRRRSTPGHTAGHHRLRRRRPGSRSGRAAGVSGRSRRDGAAAESPGPTCVTRTPSTALVVHGVSAASTSSSRTQVFRAPRPGRRDEPGRLASGLRHQPERGLPHDPVRDPPISWREAAGIVIISSSIGLRAVPYVDPDDVSNAVLFLAGDEGLRHRRRSAR